MITNADITIYNKYYDADTRTNKYKRTVVEGVFFDEIIGGTKLRAGLESSDNAFVVIPNRSLQGYLPAEDYEATNNTFTLQIGDRVVKNKVSLEIGSQSTELDKNFTAYTITSIKIRLFGSENMKHIELGLE